MSYIVGGDQHLNHRSILIKFDIVSASLGLEEELITIRLAAMKDSLQVLGRYDHDRARERFLKSYEPSNTMCVLYDGNIIGFYVLIAEKDHWFLNHIYIHPDFQGNGIGSALLESIKDKARLSKLPVRLLALKLSDANRFYKSHGFALTYQEEWDNHYEFTPESSGKI